ncbi:heterokaryon incompatibility protein 6,OR allele [Naviculisporaceae sp. PSN 640]
MNSTSPPPLPPRPAPAYPYRTLPPNTIRFICIHPSYNHNPLDSSSPITCTLETASLNHPLPPYEALSYCWGPKDQPKYTIRLNNDLPFEVTSNLHSALLRLRHAYQPRLFWIDAICINQSDIAERSSQVKHMQAIYSLASRVIIYLGENTLVDGVPIWPIPPLLEAFSSKITKRTDLPIKHGTRDWIRYVLSPDWTTNGDLRDKRWNAIIKSVILLLQQPWFLRTWIIQEAALAQHAVVISGDYQATWNDFYTAVGYAIDLDYLSATPPEMYSSLRSIERARRARAGILRTGQYDLQPQRPLDLLSSFRIFQATDPRDKVFGIYSLFTAEDLARMTLEQDYELDVVDVYTQSVIDCISIDENLDVLSLCGKECLPEHTKLPTWVPDWAYPERAKPLNPRLFAAMSFGDTGLGNNTLLLRSVTRDSKPRFFISQDKKALTLSGYILDNVSIVGGVLTKDYHQAQPGHYMIETTMMMQKESMDIFTAWEDICAVDNGIKHIKKDKSSTPGTITPYFTGESGWDVFWKTLHAGIYTFPSPPSSNPSTASNLSPEEQTRQAFEAWYAPFQTIRQFSDFAASFGTIINDSDSSTSSKVLGGLKWGGKLFSKSGKLGWNLVRGESKSAGVNRANHLALHRAMIKTEEFGYVGLASRDVKVGDQIALFEGGRMPIVVREVGTGSGTDGKRWSIVGEAYLHGIMQGEVFEQSRCGVMEIN